ncbi:alginate lyase family protein [Microlunatus soli]|uniref:Alginate lyase n=1 Tax=Microlunatus soli TaxID=630515 RepID=A0A1H1UEH9_9ACTN|nr:alginate lyase family protein [Microlunatus soli]SDS70279.1 Alginate lyase [Microlunatus soli]
MMKPVSAVLCLLSAVLLSVSVAVPSAVATPQERPRPVIFTTEAEISRAIRRVHDHQQPFYDSWLKTKAAADAALAKTYIPEQSYNHETYFGIARPQAQDARSLALVARITGDRTYADKAREILRLWARDAIDGDYPGWGSPHQMGLVIGRVVPIFADAYAMLWDELPTAERTLMAQWFGKMAKAIMISRNIFRYETETCDYGVCRYRGEPGTYLGGNYFSNHLSAHNLGLLAIGAALRDREMVAEQLDSPRNDKDLKELINGAIVMPDDLGGGVADGDLYKGDPTYTDGAPLPEPGEIWDRSRTAQGKGLHYTFLHLQLLMLQADIAKNQEGSGRDWFDYVGPRGEHLELPFEIYDDFLMTADPGARTGYYVASALEYNLVTLYELAHREYPANPDIRTVLESFDRAGFTDDHQTFGWTLPLTDGLDDLALADEPYPASGRSSWTFDSDGDFEAVTVRKAQATVADGSLNLTVNQDDPGIVTPDLLGLPTADYGQVEIRMRNRTADTQLVVYFSTDDAPVIDGSRRAAITITANDTDFTSYRIDLRQNPQWTGRIRQLRIDPVQGTSTGTVSIDSVRVIA